MKIDITGYKDFLVFDKIYIYFLKSKEKKSEDEFIDDEDLMIK